MRTKKNKHTAKKTYYQERLLECSDDEAIELIRENNKNFENVVSFHGLSCGPDPELWHRIALRIMDKAPVLGKEMLASLFFGRGGYIGEESRLNKDEKKTPEFDREQVIRDLYDAELMHPEESEQSAFYVFYKIIQFGNPDEYYWQEALKRGLDLSLSLSIPECLDPAVFLLGYIAFYAPEDSDLQKKALDGVEQIFQHKKNVFYEREFCNFCYPTRDSFRQKAFEANPDSKLHEVAFQSFCKKVKDYVKTDFGLRMSCLVTGIASHSDVLREEAATHYIESFPVFAVGNIEEAFKGYSDVIRVAISECNRERLGPEILPQYRTQVACKVLENTIDELANLDQSLADEAYDIFDGTRGMLEYPRPIAPEGLERKLSKIRDRQWDIKEKKRVYDLLKRGIDLRATLKKKE